MPQSNTCNVCSNEIKIQCRKGTGICSENCQKKHDDKGPSGYMDEAEAIIKANRVKRDFAIGA